MPRAFALRLLSATALAVAALPAAPALAAPASAPGSTALIVKWAPGSTAEERTSLLRANGLGRGKALGLANLETVELPARALTAPGIAKRLAASGLVEYAEPDPVVESTSNDPAYKELWGLHNTGQAIQGSVGVTDVDVDAPEAWAATPSGVQPVTVAVLDTGIDHTHPDLDAMIWTNSRETANGVDDDGNGFVDDVRGWDFVHDDATAFDALDGEEHGTHVAGTIAAERDNSIGVAGVTRTVRILPIKILDANGSGSGSDVIAGIAYAKRMGAKVVNLSLSTPTNSTSIRDAIANSGMTVVAAAGNSGNDVTVTPEYPGAYDLPNLVSVAAVGNRGGLASFSNYGGSTDLGAPGVNIANTGPGNTYYWMSGTSMAAPFAAGVAGTVAAVAPSLTASQVADVVTSTVTATSALAGKTTSGGMLNAAAAVNKAVALASGPDTQSGTGTTDGGTTTSPDSGSTTDPGTSDPGTTDPGTSDPSTSDPGTSDPGTSDPGTSDPGTTDPGTETPTEEPTATEACPEALPLGFTDVVAGSTHAESVACAEAWGLVNGTGENTYTPGKAVNRGQMAAFVARLLRTAGVSLDGGTDAFDDDAGNVFEADINALAAAGVVQGTGARQYSPSQTVSRAQMATFLVRAFELAGAPLPAAPDAFVDDAGSPHEGNINKSAAAGFAKGTGATSYSPSGLVTREQMASFLVRVLDRLVVDEVLQPLS